MPISAFRRAQEEGLVRDVPAPVPATSGHPSDEALWAHLSGAARSAPELGVPAPSAPMTPPSAPNLPAWAAAYLEELMNGASVTVAAKKAGIGLGSVYRVRHENPEFDVAVREAMNIKTEVLEQEAQRRAYHGVEEPVFHRGQVVGHTRKYSDLLLIFLLKARKPEVYREGKNEDARAPITLNVQVVNVDAAGTQPAEPLADAAPRPRVRGDIAEVAPELIPTLPTTHERQDNKQDGTGIPEATPVPGE